MSFVYSVERKTVLFLVSNRKLPYSVEKHNDNIDRMADKIRHQLNMNCDDDSRDDVDQFRLATFGNL